MNKNELIDTLSKEIQEQASDSFVASQAFDLFFRSIKEYEASTTKKYLVAFVQEKVTQAENGVDWAEYYVLAGTAFLKYSETF
jgi:hypothetical protein